LRPENAGAQIRQRNSRQERNDGYRRQKLDDGKSRAAAAPEKGKFHFWALAAARIAIIR
jgi:hypothetical protein